MFTDICRDLQRFVDSFAKKKIVIIRHVLFVLNGQLFVKNINII